MKFKLLFFCLLLSSCATYDEGIIPKSSQHPLYGQIQIIDTQRRKMIKSVQKQKISANLQQQILELQDYFALLPKTIPPFENPHDQELLLTYCQLGQRILLDLTYHLQQHHWKEALDALDRMRSLEQNLLRDFAQIRNKVVE